MIAISFIHLQCHTEYSLLEGALRVDSLLDYAQSLGMTSVAITDNGTMFGAIDFYLKAKERNLNPIIGCELLICPDISQKTRAYERVVFLSKSIRGYQNLVEIVTIANLEGFYYKPRIDLAHLKEFSEDLIVISPGTKGPVGELIRLGNDEGAMTLVKEFQDLYKENFYLGVHKLDVPYEDTVNQGSRLLNQQLGVPLVAINDVYFLKQEDAFIRDILSCIQTGKRLDEMAKSSFQSQDTYFKTPEEMAQLLVGYEDALENTVKIAEQCYLEIPTEQAMLPRFECPDDLTPETYIEKLVWEGIAKKYPEVTPEIKARVTYEIGVINKMQYAIYFLIIFDFLDFCRLENIPVGPGRGSAAGSIVAYALDITKIDPLKYKLLFERFLNPDRISMPDIDIDFCIKRRQEVIDYLVQRYGTSNVAQIATFGTMAARGVIRDVGRALGVPLTDVDRVAKMIPSLPGKYTSIPEALEEVPELKKWYQDSDEIKQLIDIGIKLEGQARHTSTHAAGVVISRDPLSRIVPLIRNEGQVATQYSMNDLEKVGLLKMDILGLRNLTVLQLAEELILFHHGVKLDLNHLPEGDKPTYDLLCSGETSGIFQLESRGMRQLIKDMKPQVFEDIIALLALYRPGPLGSGMVSDFVSNKSGSTKVKYELPELEPILVDTYGMIVYQEQVMQIASTIGGFTLGQADMLRKAMGKKKKDVMDKMRDDFIQGAKSKGFNVVKAEKIFDLCYKFAEYGFNKSHSAAYALISYQTAYLKANYAVEYMTALLSSVLGNAERAAIYIADCKLLGIDVLPPDVNESDIDFSIIKREGQKRAIRFGLRAIKNVGDGAIESILTERKKKGPFTSLMNFLQRVDLRQVNKRVLDSLIKCGALDQFDTRSRLLGLYENALESAQVSARDKSQGQASLFGISEDDDGLFMEPQLSENVPEYSEQTLLKMEKELLGLYISGHPLEQYRDKLGKLVHNSKTITPEMDKQEVMLGGILTEVRKVLTRTKREMLIGTLEDHHGSIPIIMFQQEKDPKPLDGFAEDDIVFVWGKVRLNQDELSISCDRIQLMETCQQSKSLYIDISSIEDEAIFSEIHRISKERKGSTPLYFKCCGQTILAHRKYWIEDDELVLSQLRGVVGSGQLWLA